MKPDPVDAKKPYILRFIRDDDVILWPCNGPLSYAIEKARSELKAGNSKRIEVLEASIVGVAMKNEHVVVRTKLVKEGVKYNEKLGAVHRSARKQSPTSD